MSSRPSGQRRPFAEVMMMMRSRVALTLWLAGVSAAWASAQVPAGPEFQVNAETTGAQGSPSIASDGTGNFVVTWKDTDAIVARRHDSAGLPIGAQFRVSGTDGDPFWVNPSVASDPAGNFVVAWDQQWWDGHSFGFPFQVYDASGTPGGSGGFGGNMDYGAGKGIAADAAGNFVAAWSSMAYNESEFSVYAQRFDSSGAARGAEFLVSPGTTYSGNTAPVVASDAAGNFVVVWQRPYSIWGQRYDSSGAPRGTEFQVNSHTLHDGHPAVASAADGDFVVAWQSWASDDAPGAVFAQRYDAAGTPLGAELQVNSYTLGNAWLTAVASDADGNFVVAWTSSWQDGDYGGIFARRYEASGAPRSAAFRVNTYTTGSQGHATVAADALGNFVVAWHSDGQDGDSFGVFAQRFGNLDPVALAVDTASTGSSDGNGIFEPGESVDVKPAYRNLNGLDETVSFAGNAGFGGPGGNVIYELQDAMASYGPLANGDTAPCSDCYQVGVSAPNDRPAAHWDATLVEDLDLDPAGQTKTWRLHVGRSFADVPKTSAYYRFVETVLHRGVAGGCTASTYCPASTTNRQQMAIFTLVAKEGAGYTPPACGTTPMYADVPVTSPYCRWVHELTRRGVVSGCGGGNFCPTASVTRAQIPIFVLKTLEPTLDPPACTTPMFGDVPASSPYCEWIEELARRGVVAGCGGGNYCPNVAVNRAQMAVFISAGFGLTLYGP
jgi:hypothetical protein